MRGVSKQKRSFAGWLKLRKSLARVRKQKKLIRGLSFKIKKEAKLLEKLNENLTYVHGRPRRSVVIPDFRGHIKYNGDTQGYIRYRTASIRSLLQQLKEANQKFAGMNASFSEKEMKGISFSVKDLVKEGFTSAGLRAFGFSLKDLKKAGITASVCRDKLGFYSVNTAADYKEAGFSAKDLKEARFGLGSLKLAGFSRKELLEAGFSETEL